MKNTSFDLRRRNSNIKEGNMNNQSTQSELLEAIKRAIIQLDAGDIGYSVRAAEGFTAAIRLQLEGLKRGGDPQAVAACKMILLALTNIEDILEDVAEQVETADKVLLECLQEPEAMNEMEEK